MFTPSVVVSNSGIINLSLVVGGGGGGRGERVRERGGERGREEGGGERVRKRGEGERE